MEDAKHKKSTIGLMEFCRTCRRTYLESPGPIFVLTAQTHPVLGWNERRPSSLFGKVFLSVGWFAQPPHLWGHPCHISGGRKIWREALGGIQPTYFPRVRRNDRDRRSSSLAESLNTLADELNLLTSFESVCVRGTAPGSGPLRLSSLSPLFTLPCSWQKYVVYAGLIR